MQSTLWSCTTMRLDAVAGGDKQTAEAKKEEDALKGFEQALQELP